MTREQAFVTAFYRLHLDTQKCPGWFMCRIGNYYARVRGRY